MSLDEPSYAQSIPIVLDFPAEDDMRPTQSSTPSIEPSSHKARNFSYPLSAYGGLLPSGAG